MKKLEPETELRILALRWLGLSHREISILTGRAKSTVAAVIVDHRGEFVDPGPAAVHTPDYLPTEDEIWGTPDPATGQRSGGLTHKVQGGFVDGDGRRHPRWSAHERMRRAGVDPHAGQAQIPEVRDPLLPVRDGLDRAAH